MKAVLMKVYHQQNSEINNMSIDDIIFYISLHMSISEYQKQQIEQQMKGKK